MKIKNKIETERYSKMNKKANNEEFKVEGNI